MPGLGLPELAIILVIVLLVFGPKRLPGIGRQLGSGLREFKDSITGGSKDDDDDSEQALTASTVEEAGAPTHADAPARTPRG